MKLDHLSDAQLSYLEGLVKKCAEVGADPKLVIKLAQASEIGGGLKDVWGDINKGISETPTMKWLASPLYGQHPENEFEPMNEYTKQLQQVRTLSQRAMDPNIAKTMKPEEVAQGQYYNQMFADPNIQAAAKKDVGPHGWARVWRGIGQLNPWGRKEREAHYGTEESMARAKAQAAAIQQYAMKNPYKPPMPKNTGFAQMVHVPGVEHTQFAEPWRSNFGVTPTYNWA